MSSQLEDAFNEAVERRTAELRAALEFYANADNYVGGEVGWWADAPGGEQRWCMDFGSIARSALGHPDPPPFFTEQQELALARCEGYEEGIAAATPDPPAAADLVAAHLRERWPCTCRPGMDGGGVYHAADCNSRREGSQAVLAVIRLLRAAAPPASPDERLREALREIVAAFPSPPDREMDDEEVERWYADHGDWFQRLTALAAADREAPDPSVSPEQEEK